MLVRYGTSALYVEGIVCGHRKILSWWEPEYCTSHSASSSGN
jgi:hypothetical protein